MNAKELYLAIGQIGDDLILGANEESSKKKKPAVYLWAAAAAACLCLIFGGYLSFFYNVTVWNTGTAAAVPKVSIPENSTVYSLSKENLSDYYHIALPDTLGGLFEKTSDALLYTDADGNVLYDRNVFCYENADGSKRLNLTLSRASSVPENNGEKKSRIRGIAVTLTEDTSVPELLLRSAQWEQNGTTVCLAAEGLTQDELISILKELI